VINWHSSIRVAALVVVVAGTAHAQSAAPAAQPLAAFDAATRNYVEMHRRLEDAVGRITINSSAESINRSMQALFAAIRAERPDAQQGDFFTPAVAELLRERVNRALFENGFSAADLLISERNVGIDPSLARFTVNGPFYWAFASMMFPCVIEALPRVPLELQYRIVGSDLLLIDVHVSLVVDILPGVLLPDEGVRNISRR